MVFKNICILVLWMKEASALEGLRIDFRMSPPDILACIEPPNSLVSIHPNAIKSQSDPLQSYLWRDFMSQDCAVSNY